MNTKYPVTPDGRYFVVRERLWRCSNPNLSDSEHTSLVSELMSARRAKKDALQNDDQEATDDAKRRVNDAKIALGERGPVWWTDGAEDFNRKLVKNSPYRAWYDAISDH